MRPRRSAVLLAAARGAVGAGCRHAAVPPAPLPPDWRALAHAPSPFAALYRFSFGGQRNLVLTVRSGESRLSLGVAVPPGGVAFAAWITDEEGWVERVKERCREPLPRGVIPVSEDASLPLDPNLAALVLSGLVPEDAHEIEGMPGWVEASNGRFVWRARIEGPPAVCTRAVVTRPDGESSLIADLKSPIGHVPGAIVLKAGSHVAELTLEEWHPSEAPQPPGWFAFAQCGATR